VVLARLIAVAATGAELAAGLRLQQGALARLSEILTSPRHTGFSGDRAKRLRGLQRFARAVAATAPRADRAPQEGRS
jgi:hypothetical protein